MIYAIGDIHGQLLKLATLLGKLERRDLGTDDVLVFMGDYVDRGPSTPEVIETLMALPEDPGPRTVFLRGNHEQMMLDSRACFDPERRAEALQQPSIDRAMLWFGEGGAATLEAYGAGPDSGYQRWWTRIPEAHWKWIEATQMEYEQGPWLFVHAGVVPPGDSWEPELPGLDPRLWIRRTFLKHKGDFGGRTVIFGHTPQLSGKPLIERHKIGIDTGAAYGGPLTAVALDLQGKLVEVVQAL